MARIDVFNGDADGICGLLQLRLNDPEPSIRITGVKRDIGLLSKVQAQSGDTITVLDISLAKNRDDLIRVLEAGASVFYVDHHVPGEIPEHPALQTLIDTDPEVCTSLLIDRHLGGRYRSWALVAAFGDNLINSAITLGAESGFSSETLDRMRLLGTCINYNGYGSAIEDLHIPPDALFEMLLNYSDPLDFMSDPDSCFHRLHQGYQDDLAKAGAVRPDYASEYVALYQLPDEAWARRVSGVFGNQLANEYPGRAHAVLTTNQQGGYQISVRAPLENKQGADELCSQFPSGGGRRGAAGINHLPIEQYEAFLKALQERYNG